MMEKVLVSVSGPCLDDKDLVTLLGEFTIVASPNLENVIKKLKLRSVSNVLDIK
jgi:hypothetical protein